MKPKALEKMKEAAFRSAFAERLKLAAQEHEVAGLAAKIGVTPATLYRWLSAKFDPSLPKLAELADAMQVSLAWLVTGVGPKDGRRALRQGLLEDYETTDFEAVGGKPEKAPVAFHEPWLFRLLFGTAQEPTSPGPAPGDTTPLLVEVREDSMEPTIAQGDIVLVDRSFGTRSREVRQAQTDRRSPFDGIYAFRSRALRGGADKSAGHSVIRRVQYRLDETMVIRCDNPKYPEESYVLEAKNLPQPTGRVIWRGGSV